MFDIRYEYDIKRMEYVAIGTLSKEASVYILNNWDEIRTKTGCTTIGEFMEKLKAEMQDQLHKVMRNVLEPARDERWANMQGGIQRVSYGSLHDRRIELSVFHNGKERGASFWLMREEEDWRFKSMILDRMVEDLDKELTKP